MRKPTYKKRTVVEESKRRLVNTIPPGRQFGDWTVVKKATKLDYLTCTCVCGRERDVHVYSLTTGKSVSCGCRRLKKKDANA